MTKRLGFEPGFIPPQAEAAEARLRAAEEEERKARAAAFAAEAQRKKAQGLAFKPVAMAEESSGLRVPLLVVFIIVLVAAVVYFNSGGNTTQSVDGTKSKKEKCEERLANGYNPSDPVDRACLAEIRK